MEDLCLLELREVLQFLAGHDIMRRNNPAQCQLVTGNKKAQEMAWEMIDIIQDSKFWAAITCIKSHLEPLAIAANITQAATCWLDQVMFTLGFLYYKFLQFTDPQDGAIRQVVLGSISEHWNKCDWQDVGLGCAILNPFVSLSSFHHIEQLSKNGILQLMQRLWTQFYNSNAPQELLTNINDYFDHKGSFIAVESAAVMHLNLAANELKMLIQDEHLCTGDVKTRLKWKFGALSPIDQETTSASTFPTSPTPPGPSSTDFHPPPSTSFFTTGTSLPRQNCPRDSTGADEFLTLVRNMEQMVDEDIDVPTDFGSLPATTSVNQPFKVALSDLFNFNTV
ncbi:hypothetical protein PM082_004948 [Marasmius tenuissimus]|nr:hypothetical protein PM082_004948 [Marasmius tenuissimus]